MKPVLVLLALVIVLQPSSFRCCRPPIAAPTETTGLAPLIRLEEASVQPMNMIYIRDTVASMSAISAMLDKSYGELFGCISQQGLVAGRVMAFYYSWQAPMGVDAAVEVNRFPLQTVGRIRINKVNGGNAVIAHYQGPYSSIEKAYDAISGWLKRHGKTRNGIPFEVYMNAPAMVTDSFDLKTDVYQLVK